MQGLCFVFALSLLCLCFVFASGKMKAIYVHTCIITGIFSVRDTFCCVAFAQRLRLVRATALPVWRCAVGYQPPPVAKWGRWQDPKNLNDLP